METKKRPHELRHELEPILLTAANAEIREEAVQLYADLLGWEDWLYPPKYYQPRVDRLLATVASAASQTPISTAPFEHNTRFHEVE